MTLRADNLLFEPTGITISLSLVDRLPHGFNLHSGSTIKSHFNNTTQAAFTLNRDYTRQPTDHRVHIHLLQYRLLVAWPDLHNAGGRQCFNNISFMERARHIPQLNPTFVIISTAIKYFLKGNQHLLELIRAFHVPALQVLRDHHPPQRQHST